jgi:hypothetical protein
MLPFTDWIFEMEILRFWQLPDCMAVNMLETKSNVESRFDMIYFFIA